MLVLTRKVGEKLIIGDDVVVQVLSVNGDQVKIGIQAPPSVTIHRNEVYEAILNSRRSSAVGADTPFLPQSKPVLNKKNKPSD